VVTDVGDSAFIVGNTGLVVPPKNPQMLSEAWCRIIKMSKEERIALGLSGRQRIKENFSI